MSADEPPLQIEVNPGEQRLYNRLRQRLVPLRPGEDSELRDLLLCLPDFVVFLSRVMRDSRVPRGPRLIAGVAVAYVLSPLDLLPTLLFGPLGLLDDWLFAVGAVSILMKSAHPDVLRHHWPGQGDALEATLRVAAWAEGHFGARIHRGFAMLGLRPRARS